MQTVLEVMRKTTPRQQGKKKEANQQRFNDKLIIHKQFILLYSMGSIFPPSQFLNVLVFFCPLICMF